MAIVIAFAKRLIALSAFPATIMILAWWFSPTMRDRFVELYAISVFIAMLSRFGADQFLYKTISTSDLDRSYSSPYSHKTLMLSLILSTFGIVAWTAIFPSGFDWSERLTVAATVIAMILLMDRATTFQMRGNTLLSSLSYPTFFLAIILFALAASAAIQSAFLIAAGVTAILCLTLLLVKNKRNIYRSITLPALTHKLLPYAALGVNRAFFDWGVSVYLVVLINPGALSIFIISNRLAAMLSIPASSLNAYLLREFSVNISTKDTSANRQLMKQSIRLCLFFQAIIITIYAFTFPLIADLFKIEETALASLLIPLSIAQIVHGLTGPVSSMLLMSGHERLVATISISVAIGSLIFGYLATMLFGLIGLGVALGAMLILQNIFYVVAMWRTERYLPFAGAMGFGKGSADA